MHFQYIVLYTECEYNYYNDYNFWFMSFYSLCSDNLCANRFQQSLQYIKKIDFQI